jgi:hypothetical protein
MKWRAAEIHYAWYERFAMRLLFAVLLEQHIPASLSSHIVTFPHGFGRLIDLRFLLDQRFFTICRYLFLAALVLYVLRIGWSVVLPYMTLLSIAVGTILNSKGAIAHFMQIVSLVLCAQTAAHFYSKFKRRRHDSETPDLTGEDRVIFWSQQAIVATYLVSALTKLIHTSGAWFIQSPLIAVQIIKTTDQDYYDQLDASAYGSGVALANWIVQHPLLVGVVLSLGLLLELTAPLALLGRGMALVYGLGLIAFHESVQRAMKLNFLYNEYLIWIYLVNVPFWIMFAARSLAAMRTRKQ